MNNNQKNMKKKRRKTEKKRRGGKEWKEIWGPREMKDWKFSIRKGNVGGREEG